MESHLVARGSQRRPQVQRASSEGLDAITEAVVTLDREQAARQRRLKKPRRHLNSRGESTSASEDSDEGDVGVKRNQVCEAAARLRTARFLSEMSPDASPEDDREESGWRADCAGASQGGTWALSEACSRYRCSSATLLC